jgi:3-hydroxyacyl-CoA dehydrogenase
MTATRNQRVGFIGLGTMGSPMAANVVWAGFPLTAWNLMPSKTQAGAAQTGASAAGIAARADAPMPQGHLNRAVIARAIAAGFADHHMLAVARHLRTYEPSPDRNG